MAAVGGDGDGRPAEYVPSVVAGIGDDRSERARYAIERYGPMRHAIRLITGRYDPVSSFGPVTVPAGHYLLLGGNRDDSLDSRHLGFFPRQEIVGRARYVALSLDPDRHYLPRPERFGAALD